MIEYESGRLDSRGFYTQLCDLAGLKVDYVRFRMFFGDIFTPISEMVAAQAQLRAQDVPTFIFSNTNEIAVTHIRATYDFFNRFTDHILSYQVGGMKPHAAIYSALEERTGRKGQQIFYLDDRLENIHAAQARGWRTVHHTTPALSLASLRDAGFFP
jgi:FMN phosphatase YigB (HAD superfamily)